MNSSLQEILYFTSYLQCYLSIWIVLRNLLSFGEITVGDVCLRWNIMELDGSWHDVLKVRRNTFETLNRNVSFPKS